ncbi:MAG: hypothetical protein ABI601_08835 [bacterium]
MRASTALLDVARARRRAAHMLTMAALAAGLTGCATLRATLHGYDQGRNGIARVQERLRDALVAGDFPTALAWREDDALLRALTQATSAYYASQFQRAGALLDSAALLADDRITTSVSRDALALVTSDNARPYQTRPTERLFIAYYGMLSYARLESWEEAAVEARRLVALVAQRDGDREAEEQPLHATLEHLAGAVFERAGRAGEAQVAYRAAHRILAAAPENLPRLAEGEGEVLVVVERGFVAHRVTEQLNVFFGDDEGDDDTLDTSRRGGRRPSSSIESIGHVWSSRGNTPPRSGDIDTTRAGRRRHHDDDGGYWLAVAFPALRRGARPSGETIQLSAEGVSAKALPIASVLDDAAAVDERRDRLAMMARAIARASAKYAIAKAVKDTKGETAGKLANMGVSLLERADVRSWHLLPQEVRLLRLTVPAGPRALRLVLSGGRVVDLGLVTVRPGEVTIVPYRLWRDEGSSVPQVAAR